MRILKRGSMAFISSLIVVTGVVACGSSDGADDSDGSGATGGSAGATDGSGGATGGASSGGASSGGSSSGGASNTGGTDSGGSAGADMGGAAGVAGMAGAGGAGEEPAPPSLYGSWAEECVAEPGAETVCDTGWELRFGRGVLGGPETFASRFGACSETDDEFTFGTFAENGPALTLSNCPHGELVEGAYDSTEREFGFVFDETGERLTLTETGAPARVFRRLPKSTTSAKANRLISFEGTGCDSSSQTLVYHTLSGGDSSYFDETLTLQGGQLYMDEFFESDSETTGTDSWGFYDASDRGAQTAQFPASPGPLSSYRVLRDADLEPLFAVGAEWNCSTRYLINAEEHDFRTGHTYKRYYDYSSHALDATRSVEVENGPSSIEEVLVTVDIQHPSMAELTLTLTSPSGTTITLASGASGNGGISGYAMTTFSDAGDVILTDTSVTTYEALVVPRESLAAFRGASADGVWTLTVTDDAGDNEGTVDYFGISIR